MNWEDFGSEARAPDARRDRRYDPVVEYKAGALAEVSVPLEQVPQDEAMWRAEIERVTGLTVPEGRRVELAQVRYWGQPEAPNVYCRFLIVDRDDAAPDVDAVRILQDLRKGRRTRTGSRTTGESTFCIGWGDWQVAKSEGGGTAGVVERLDKAFDAAVIRIKELRKLGRNIGQLVVLGGGDMVEGCTIFGNQPFEIDSDRRAQVRNTTALILEGLDRLAPMFDGVRVLVIPGNHGENRINGKRTTRSDNDDCAVFEHAALAVGRDPRLGHVKFYIAKDEPAKTLDVNGHILAATHGHVFARGGGGIAQRAHKWFSGQAAGRLPAGDADLLVTFHYHHFFAQDWGSVLWMQSPAMDGGSPFYTDSSGMHSKPGMLTWVMSPESRCSDIQIL